jgi:hypothetical protein
MALDRNALATALLAGFQMGMDDPDWTKEQAAEAMADAIDTYVRGAAVTGISTAELDHNNDLVAGRDSCGMFKSLEKPGDHHRAGREGSCAYKRFAIDQHVSVVRICSISAKLVFRAAHQPDEGGFDIGFSV